MFDQCVSVYMCMHVHRVRIYADVSTKTFLEGHTGNFNFPFSLGACIGR